jgi:hypothetical protein
MDNLIQLELFPEDVLEELRTTGDCFTPKIQTMIKVMLDIGMSPKVLCLLLEFTGLNKEHKYYFGAPIVAKESGWMDAIPDWIKSAVYKERFEIICKEYNEDNIGIYASYSEAMCVLMPASMEAPLTKDWANIYTWLGKQVCIKHQKNKEEDFEGICDFQKLSDYENSVLKNLLADIRKKAIKNSWR